MQLGAIVLFLVSFCLLGMYILQKNTSVDAVPVVSLTPNKISDPVGDVSLWNISGSGVVVREIPQRDASKTQTKVVGLPPLLTFGAEPLNIRRYESTNQGYYIPKSKEFNFSVSENFDTVVPSYREMLQSSGWEIQDSPSLLGTNSAWVSTSQFYARKDSKIFTFRIFPEISPKGVSKENTQFSILAWIDPNVVYLSPPKTDSASLPPLPKANIILQSIVGYTEQSGGSLQNMSDTYAFVMTGKPDTVVNEIVQKLTADGYTMEWGKQERPKLQNSSQTPVSPPVALLNSPAYFIPFASQKSEVVDPMKLLEHSVYGYSASKDGQTFDINFSQNIPGTSEILEDKTIIVLRTSVIVYQEGVEYFRTKASTYPAYAQIPTLTDKDVFVSYDMARMNTSNSVSLPDPIVFSTSNGSDFLESISKDLTQLGYGVEKLSTEPHNTLIRARWPKGFQYEISSTDSPPKEFKKLFPEGTMITIKWEALTSE